MEHPVRPVCRFHADARILVSECRCLFTRDKLRARGVAHPGLAGAGVKDLSEYILQFHS